MAFFDDLTGKLKNGSKTAVNKAKDVADVTKLRTEIMSEESKIKTLYAEIGEKYCDQAAGEVDPEFLPLVEKVKASRTTIAEYRAEIQKIKGMNFCPKCGAEAAADAQFCSNCGAPIIPAAKEDNCCCTEEKEEESCCCTEEKGEDNCCCTEEKEEDNCCCTEEKEEESCCS